MVSLTSLPLSLGIAIASGAPPIAGLMSAIIAGLIFPFLGGPFVTISGPAAGLAPALYAAMHALGHGDLNKGYPLLLAVICLVGGVQVILARFGAAKLSAAFPAAVVEGMLAAIGLMIIAKELPHLIGHDFKSHAFFGILVEVPEELSLMDPKSFQVGSACLALLFFLGWQPIRNRLPVPPPLLVVVVGIALGQFLGIDEHHMIRIPENVLAHGIVPPDFGGLAADKSLWFVAAASVLTLVLIDGVESLATIKAIDRVDPYKRRSNPDRTLFAMGVSNFCSSLGGGLTIIPGGVKSKLCIVSGGKTLWANFYNALFLISFLFIGKNLINMIPYSALAAILIHTGFKMCEPKLWRHMAHIGIEQLVLFSVTIVATLATDLLVGIFTGMGVKLLINAAFTSRYVVNREGRPMTFANVILACFRDLRRVFSNPVTQVERVEGGTRVRINRALVCFNLIHLERTISRLPEDAGSITIELGPDVDLIDHTSVEYLLHFEESYERSGRGTVVFEGLDRMGVRSHSPSGMRFAPFPALAFAGAPVGDNLEDVRPIE
jgi:MFS superfamily sulfate permease-like transporter